MDVGEHKTRILVILATISLLRGLLYGAIIPPWQAPDEPKHFEYLWLLYEKRHLVTRNDASLATQQAIIASMNEYEFWRFGRGALDPNVSPQSFEDIWGAGGPTTLLHRPPLYYLLNLPVYALVADEDIVARLYALRLVSAVLGVLIVLAAYLTARELFPDDELMYIGVPSLVALLPMLSFMFGSFNYDNLANLFTSWIWYLVVALFRHRGSWRRMLGIVALVAGAIATKRTTFSIMPVLLFGVPIYLWTARKHGFLNWRIVLVVITVSVVTICLGILGWMMLGEEAHEALTAALSRYFFNYPGQLQSILRRLPEPSLATATWWTQRLFVSFWADFGWLRVRLAPIWYIVLAAVCTAAIGGFLLLAIRQVRGIESLETWKWQCLFLFGLHIARTVVASMVFFSAYVGTRWERAPQGRHIFLGIVPCAILFMMGLRELVPMHSRRLFLIIVIVAFIMFDSLCSTRYIIPFFYG